MEENSKELFDRMAIVADVVNEGSLSGFGAVNEIVSLVSTVLRNGQQYGFTFRFWNIEAEPQHGPWD